MSAPDKYFDTAERLLQELNTELCAAQARVRYLQDRIELVQNAFWQTSEGRSEQKKPELVGETANSFLVVEHKTRAPRGRNLQNVSTFLFHNGAHSTNTIAKALSLTPSSVSSVLNSHKDRFTRLEDGKWCLNTSVQPEEKKDEKEDWI